MFTSKLCKVAYLCAKLECIGREDLAIKIASNKGIQALAETLNSAALAKDLKEALEKELTKKGEKYSGKKATSGNIANFKRVDPKNISEEDHANHPKETRVTDHMKKHPPGSLAEMDFIKEKVPRISYQ